MAFRPETNNGYFHDCRQESIRNSSEVKVHIENPKTALYAK